MKPRAVRPSELPDDTRPRIRILAENAKPNPDRPRMSEEIETALAPIDAQCRVTYTEMEEEAFRIRRLAMQLAAIKEGQKNGR